MNKTEIATIKNVITRLKKPNCGCSNGMNSGEIVKAANEMGIEAVSRIYLDTWIIPALELLIAEGRTTRDLQLARDIART
jgi:hypothetical protein